MSLPLSFGGRLGGVMMIIGVVVMVRAGGGGGWGGLVILIRMYEICQVESLFQGQFAHFTKATK